MNDAASTSTPRPRPVLGVSVSVWRGDHVVLIRRGRPPSEGLWAPVGGKVEWGETLAEAARREVMEEAGIACEIVAMSDVRELISPQSDWHVVLAVFAARWLRGDPLAGDDAADAVWVHRDELAQYALVEGALPYILATRDLMTGRPAPLGLETDG